MATASALTNTFSATGTAVKEQFADVLDVRFNEIATRKWAKPMQGLKFYKQQNTSRAYEKYSSVTGLGLARKARDVDPIPLTEKIQGFDVTITPEEYKLGLQLGVRLLETDQFGVIDRHMADLNQSMMDTVELYAALPFNTAQDATVEWICADGMNLIDSTRNREDGEGTWGNEETGAALSQSSIDTMRLNFRKNVSERGRVAPITMESIIVPNDLQSSANVYLDTKQKVGTAFNDDSVLNRYGLRLEVWDYLTSATRWFGMGPKDEKHELYWLWAVKPGTVKYDVNNPDVYAYRSRMVFATGCNRPHNIRGNAGA